MVAVAASTHGLDALYGAVKDLIPSRPPSAGRPARRRVILETLKRGFRVGKLAHGWLGEFDWLFGLRDAALHFGGIFHEPVPHPLGTNTAVEAVLYSRESASRAVGLLLEVLRTCSDKPRPTLPPVVKWATDYRPAIERLLTLRPTQ